MHNTQHGRVSSTHEYKRVSESARDCARLFRLRELSSSLLVCCVGMFYFYVLAHCGGICSRSDVPTARCTCIHSTIYVGSCVHARREPVECVFARRRCLYVRLMCVCVRMCARVCVCVCAQNMCVRPRKKYIRTRTSYVTSLCQRMDGWKIFGWLVAGVNIDVDIGHV